MRGIIADAGQPDDRPVPEALIADFGYGEVKAMPEPFEEAPEDLALVLEGKAAVQEQFDFGSSDDHGALLKAV